MERAGVEAGLYEPFGPLIDVREGSRMGFVDRKIAQSVMVGLSGELGLEFDVEGRNDLRDRVREYAYRFAESLRDRLVHETVFKNNVYTTRMELSTNIK